MLRSPGHRARLLRQPSHAARRALCAAALAGLALPGAAAAQGVPRPPAEREAFAEAIEVRYVLVPLTVRDSAGVVTDLEQREVRLYVDDAPVPIESFERGSELPLSLVLLQDLSGSMAAGSKLDRARAAAGCLLDRRRPGDRIALATFADRRTVVEVPFTAEAEPLRAAMAAWRAYGLTALYDAVAQLPRIDPRGQIPRKAAVLLTDGSENASRLSPERSRDLVRAADLPVYALDLGGRDPAGRPAAEVAPGPRRARQRELLRRLAYGSGGRYLAVATAEEAIAACVEVSAELRGQFVLGFRTAEVGERRWRRLRVEIGRRGLRYAARAGYLGRAPAAGVAGVR